MKYSYVLVVFSSVLPLLLLGLIAPTASANPVGEVWHDDMESGSSGWYTMDLTAGAVPHFHWDTYMAYEGERSWWCGNFDYDADGGYGNSWDDRLELPPIYVNPVAVENVSWAVLKALYRDGPSGGRSGRARDPVMPVLTFAYRHDSEIGYDFTYVQAESNGVYVSLNRGYDGRQPWTDIGPYGFDLSNYNDPLRVRFRFISDGAWSDEDGLYMSVAGGFAVDNIKVYDFSTGEVLFYDTTESDSPDFSIPAIPGAAGDYWHIIDRACPAYSDPHCWWCGDDGDTSLVPPNLQNGLFSPVVDLYSTVVCTAFFAMHFAVPTVDNDYVAYYGTVGSGYYGIGAYWGDFGSCDGWSSTAFNRGYDIGQFATPYSYSAGMLFIMYTTDNGCGPGGAGDAGVMLDDLWLCSMGEDPWEGRRTTNLYDAESYPGAAKSIRAQLGLIR
ncbi:hypothetical protein KAW64_12040 [bacterium]|nr:hypothetical protein [bacterium]